MNLRTNTTDRKQLAHALAIHLATDVVYLGPPSFAYKVGEITVTRDGTLEGEDLEALKPFLMEQGYLDEEDLHAEQEQEATLDEEEPTLDDEEAPQKASEAPSEDAEPTPPDAEASTEITENPDIHRMEITIHNADLTASQLRNLIFMLSSKQYLLGRAIGEQTIRIENEVVAQLQQSLPETKEAFIQTLEDFKATGQLVGVDVKEDDVCLTFPFCKDSGTLYMLLASRIVEAARTATRVEPDPLRPENEKYFMRGWLVRLGLGGAEHKEVRKHLLKDLKGHTAFPTEIEAQRHREKYAALRREKRELEAGRQPHDV